MKRIKIVQKKEAIGMREDNKFAFAIINIGLGFIIGSFVWAYKVRNSYLKPYVCLPAKGR